MAKSTGLGLVELPGIFARLHSDAVITVGDRFETMAAAVAAVYMNIPLAHTMGGEVTGNIDESVRHAVTKLAHVHFPASKLAGENIVRMGEDPSTVHVVGCPRVDITAQALQKYGTTPIDWEEELQPWAGVGPKLDFKQPFVMVAQHPVTTEFGDAEFQINQTLEAINRLGMQALMFWPNADAGQDAMSQGIRKFREIGRGADYLHIVKNLPVELYIRLMDQCKCIVGNSSSAIREGAFIGVPAVNVGSRQSGRERAANVMNAPYCSEAIFSSIQDQLAHAKYPRDTTYGDGHAGQRIAEIMATAEFQIQKRLWY
jgi:UDP-hydrolysing UDP-N-acetyl-D-glucosamine 2-epimerase